MIAIILIQACYYTMLYIFPKTYKIEVGFSSTIDRVDVKSTE